jgi:hypothetical protein
VLVHHFGWTGGDAVEARHDVAGTDYNWNVSLADLRAAHEGFFPALMQGEL